MKLIENGEALDQVTDLLQSGDPVDPGDMIEDGVFLPKPMTQFEESLKKEYLSESRRSEASIAEYLKTTRNPSFQDYRNSQFYDNSIKSTWFFNRDIKNIMANGGVNVVAAQSAINNSNSRSSTKQSVGISNSYIRPSEGSVKPKYLTDIQKKYELDKIDINSKGTAEEMYDNMESTIRDILTQESTVRHALIKTIDQGKFNKLLETSFIGQSAA